MIRVFYPFLFLFYLSVGYYLTHSTPVECKTVFQPGYTMGTDIQKMVVYKHTITYCNHSFSEHVYTLPDAVLGVVMRNDWIRQYPNKTFYQTIWGIHRDGGVIAIYFNVFIFIFMLFAAHITALEEHHQAQMLVIKQKDM